MPDIQWFHDEVIYRGETFTEMLISPRARAKMLAAKLIKAEKGFEVICNCDGTWTFTVYENNHPNKWEAA